MLLQLAPSILRRPDVQFGQIGILQCVLILRVALPAADAQILRGLQKERGAGNVRQLAANPGDDLIGARSCAPPAASA